MVQAVVPVLLVKGPFVHQSDWLELDLDAVHKGRGPETELFGMEMGLLADRLYLQHPELIQGLDKEDHRLELKLCPERVTMETLGLPNRPDPGRLFD
jgi:hypothetical protein